MSYLYNMATSRPFAYNTGTTISGTTQVGSLAVGTPAVGFQSTGLQWWNGPDETLGYVIAQSVSANTQPTPVSGQTASVGFFRSPLLTEASFIQLAQKISQNQIFTAGTQANTWLNNNGYWSSWLDVYTYDSGSTLSWPSSSAGYTLYNGGFTNSDDGFSNAAIVLPTAFSTNGSSSSNLYISTNGYFTIGSGSGGILSGPTQASPASMCANPADNWLQPGLVMADGDTQNAYYQTGTSGSTKYYVKLLVYGGTYQATTTPKSWIANFYRDSTYQWLEVRAKSNVVGQAGPYNAVSVAQTSSTTSRVWRGDLNGQNWVYLGTGRVI